MTKSILLSIALMFTIVISKAQTVMQISGNDCNGTAHNLHDDLDAGKAAVLFFFMPSCGSCPPPAQKIQTMVNNILETHPGMVTGYAMPFNNSTSCNSTASWVTNNNLNFYAPYSNGATHVANYGGFGMPTVALVGGAAPNRRVMFSTLSFSTSDTIIMRDSILALLSSMSTAVNEIPKNINSINVYPNPASTNVSIDINLKEQADLVIDVLDITGKQVAVVSNAKKQNDDYSVQFNTEALANGIYTIRINANGQTANRKLNVLH